MAIISELKIEGPGAVTFVDILGWKGIWQRRTDAIDILQGLISELETRANTATSTATSLYPTMRGTETIVLSISDTIAIFTPGDPVPTTKIHGELCKYAIPESIKRMIPLRGATAYGDFSCSANVMLGPAVDEAASWHEATDWFGVTLTPTARFKLGDQIPNEWTRYSKIPFKGKVPNLDICVDWAFQDEKNILDYFSQMGPHTPEIAAKYLNTYNFITREQTSMVQGILSREK